VLQTRKSARLGLELAASRAAVRQKVTAKAVRMEISSQGLPFSRSGAGKL
jgi:hypothetical protein